MQEQRYKWRGIYQLISIKHLLFYGICNIILPLNYYQPMVIRMTIIEGLQPRTWELVNMHEHANTNPILSTRDNQCWKTKFTCY